MAKYLIQSLARPCIDQRDIPGQETARTPQCLLAGAVAVFALLAQHRPDDITRVTGHDVHAITHHGTHGIQVNLLLGLQYHRPPRGNSPDLRQTQQGQQADIGPPQIKFPPLAGKTRRGREGMVVGMQFLATDDQAPGQDITRRIGGLVIAITPIVADAIDHTRRPERDPHHLHRPQHQAGGTEQRDIKHRHQRDADIWKARVYVPLEPVIRCQVTIAIEGFLLGRLVPVKLTALP